MGKRFAIFIGLVLFASQAFGQTSGTGSRIDRSQQATTVIGPRNVPLYEGAQALLSGNNEQGIELTLEGLEIAHGRREEEAALSNLCAGYIKVGKYSEALKYCDILLTRNEKNWRGYNNRAVIYIMTKQYEKAESDLVSGEALNPGARTLKVARAMYMDAVHPVRPEIEIDDRDRQNDQPPQ